FRPTVFDRHILAFDIARFLQALVERRDLLAQRSGRRGIEEAGHRHLLCACRERPGCRAAEKRDELAPSHSMTSSARDIKLSENFTPSALAVLRLITNSNLVGCMTGRSAGLAPFRTRPA